MGKTRKEIREHMWNSDVQIKQSRLPNGWSTEAADFINQWIKRKKIERYGHKPTQDIKSHPWLKGIDWKALYEKRLKAPFIPISKENYDTKATSYAFRDDYSIKSLKDAIGMMEGKIQDVEDIQEYFKDYYFDHREKKIESGLYNSTVFKDFKTPGTKPQTL